ncbi:MAG: DNA topology modulation protein FlaR [Pseudomonadota bacterium]
MKRIMVIGGSGSGKSTLAQGIGAITGLPVIHIDKIYWKAGWVSREATDTQRMVVDTAQAEAWVLDGNNSSTFNQRADRADAIIFLDLPTWLRFSRVVWRAVAYYGRSRPDMTEGCTERLDYNFLKWVLGYRTNGGRIRALALIETYASRARIHHLRSRREVDEFLTALQAEFQRGHEP